MQLILLALEVLEEFWNLTVDYRMIKKKLFTEIL